MVRSHGSRTLWVVSIVP